MRLLVTGGLGFIGSNFINYWLKQHPDGNVLNLDKMTYAASKNNVDYDVFGKRYSLHIGDICDEKLVNDLTTDVDAIVNFAAESHVDNSIKSPREFLYSNFIGVYSLIETARKRDIRIHHISTDEVFGSLQTDSNKRFDEHTCYNPRNPYSASKAASDHLVRSYINTYGIEATISNCGNNYGPRQHPEKLIPKTVLNALSNLPIPIYGDGNNLRDWVFVLDHCRAISLIIHKGKIGETYLVSSGSELRNNDIVSKILELMNKPKELIEHVEDRPGHDLRYSIDATKIRKELGWRPEYSLEDGLKETIEYYRRLKI